MNAKKILALMLCAMMLLSLAACGAKDNDKQADMSGDSSAMTGEPKNRRGGARSAQGAAGAGKRAPVGKCRTLGEGVHGGR